MIKLMKYLKKSAGYIVLIIALLFLQAYCDLSLPDYTSKIINVGIQQKGIEDSVPDKLRDSTLQNLQIFMDEDQKKEVSQNYTQEEDTWVLNDDISKETRENLNEDFSKAMMMVSAFSEDSEQGQAMVAQMGLPVDHIVVCDFLQSVVQAETVGNGPDAVHVEVVPGTSVSVQVDRLVIPSHNSSKSNSPEACACA